MGIPITDANSVVDTVLTDLVVDASLGTAHKQHIAIQDGTVGGTNKLIVDSSGRARVDASGVAVPVTDNGGSLSIDDGGGSLTVDGTLTIGTGPAAGRTTDSIAATLSTDAIMNALTALPPKFHTITASTSGATTIVALVSAKKIRVLAWSLVCNAAVNVKWQSHATPTDLTGLHYFAANGGIAMPFSPVGYFETVAGEALDINLSGNIAVGGSLVYIEV